MITQEMLDKANEMRTNGVTEFEISSYLLKDISSKTLTSILLYQRTDQIFVGGTYCKQRVMELCDATVEEAEAFMEQTDPLRYDWVEESATENLRQLFESWQEEDEQECF